MSQAFPAERQGAAADKLHVQAAKYPLLDSPDPSKIQLTVGMGLSINSALGHPGLDESDG